MANGNDWWRGFQDWWQQVRGAGGGAWPTTTPGFGGATPYYGAQAGRGAPFPGMQGGRGAPLTGWEVGRGTVTPQTIPFQYLANARSPWQEGMQAPQGMQPVPGQYTPSQGFGMLPSPTRATPGRIPTTTVEQALADVVATAIGSFGPQREAIMAQAGQGPQREPGPWGGELGRYPVPWGAIEGMPSWRREWEEWSWSERGIPLQGYEIWRLSRNRPPWGVPPRE